MNVCIVGTSRCGTTLLRSILHEHPELFLFNETHWIPRMFEFFGTQSVSWKDFFNIAKKTTWVCGRDLFSVNLEYTIYDSKEKLLEEFTRELKAAGKVNIQQFSQMFANVAFDRPAYWGDKTPDYGYYMSLIQHLWPDCKFIHVVRDGLSAARSMSKHPGCQLMMSAGYDNWCSLAYDSLYEKYSITTLPMTAYIESWCRRMRRIRDEARRLKADSYLEVQYEEILADAPAVANRIAGYLDIPVNSDWPSGLKMDIKKNKLSPACDMIDKLASLDSSSLQLLNEGYGKKYFLQYATETEIELDIGKFSNSIANCNAHEACKTALSILASPFSKGNVRFCEFGEKILAKSRIEVQK